MPDILIRGMEMPGSCAACDFYNVISGRCTRTGTKINFSELTTRSVDCPISELPPHGDLIDVSKIVLEYGGLAKISPYDFVGIAKYFAKQIEGQPVVVPAEKEETE